MRARLSENDHLGFNDVHGENPLVAVCAQQVQLGLHGLQCHRHDDHIIRVQQRWHRSICNFRQAQRPPVLSSRDLDHLFEVINDDAKQKRAQQATLLEA